MALCDYNMHRNSYPVLSHEMNYKAAHWHGDVARGIASAYFRYAKHHHAMCALAL